MEGLIETGEEWMEPMLEFRDWLKEARERNDFREKERRDGREGPGPFNKEARITILKRLLEVQKQTGLTLITEDELSAIQWIWHHDYRNPPVVADIYREVIGEESSSIQSPFIEKRREEKVLLERMCVEEGIPADLVEQLVQIEKDKSGLMRRHGLFQDIDAALEKYIRSDVKDAHI
jgi:DNA sulfur modification protein DndC